MSWRAIIRVARNFLRNGEAGFLCIFRIESLVFLIRYIRIVEKNRDTSLFGDDPVWCPCVIVNPA